MAQIVFLDRAGLAQHITLPAINTKSHIRHQVIEYATSSPAQVIERLHNAQVAVVNKVIIDRAVLKGCPQLEHIAVSATGYNNIDLPACIEYGVSVSNIPTYATTTVPEHAITMMLALRRQIMAYRAHVNNGDWSNSPVFCLFKEPINDLKHSTLGIVGYGDLGRATANLGKALGMRVVYTSRSAKSDADHEFMPLNDLLALADVVSLHCALNDATQNLIGAEQLALMRPNALLINTARGGLVDEQALVEAIQNNQLAGIGFDVLAQEPPTAASPLLSIADRSNVIITPHVAWASDQAMTQLAAILINNISAFLNGEPQNTVT